MNVVIPVHVRNELFWIALNVAQDNPAAADKLVDALEARCLKLGENPDRGTVIATRKGVAIRRLVEGRYLIVYSVTADQVRIHRITHGARSPRLLLKDLDLS